MIHELEQLADCSVCPIDHYQWVNGYQPKAYAQMGLLEGKGLVVSMTAVEENPLRRYHQENEPVYQDSGLEVFLNFDPNDEKDQYMNFEMNAYGTILSQFGTNKNRKWLSELTKHRATCNATMNEKDWNVLLHIPMDLICEFNEGKPLKQGDEISFNLYKISEDPSIEHYASYAPIDHPVPNFHLPQFFAKAIIGD